MGGVLSQVEDMYCNVLIANFAYLHFDLNKSEYTSTVGGVHDTYMF